MAEPTIAAAYPGQRHDAEWRRLVYPPEYRNPSPKRRYHLIVIGAGPAGLVTAIAAAGLGAKVALIERQAMGGDCLNVGCVPSKALLEFSASHAGQDGFNEAFEWLRAVRAGIAEHDSVERYSAAGVDVFLGAARFVDTTTVKVGDVELKARRIVVASGARAAMPPIPGLADARPLTNESVFDLLQRPKRIAVIGAGPIGCELSQAFSRMRIDVNLLDVADRVLANESLEASRIVTQALKQSGVKLHLEAKIARVERRGPLVVLDTDKGEILADEVLVAAGRRANTDDLNLAAVNVDTDESGQIIVDRFLRSSNPRIYAAGDVCSKQQFTHLADAHARIVVQNALFFPSATKTKLIVPHCTYTDPEVASVGESGQALAARNQAYDTYRIAYGDLDRGRAQGDSDGYVEVLTAQGQTKILGATIVGRDAGEQIAPLCFMMTRGLGIDAFAKTILPYPTRAEYLRRLADTFNRGRLTPSTKRLFSMWFKWIR